MEKLIQDISANSSALSHESFDDYTGFFVPRPFSFSQSLFGSLLSFDLMKSIIDSDMNLSEIS